MTNRLGDVFLFISIAITLNIGDWSTVTEIIDTNFYIPYNDSESWWQQ